jgi:hypothetical protein
MRRLIARFWYERRNRCPWACNEMHTETGFCLIAQQRERDKRVSVLEGALEYIKRNKLS